MMKLTPMMAQYNEIKAKHEGCILMFRMGDFYEMFFDDALEASKILQITLTSRNKNGVNKTPMCGIPYHAVNQYLPKLTRAGKKVAICDQMTQPDGKGIVQREVVRVVTPGTTFDDNILDTKVNNYVACVVEVGVRDKRGGGERGPGGSGERHGNGGKYATNGRSFAFAYADITTGDFKVTELSGLSELEAEIVKIRPAECICDEALLADSSLQKILNETYAFPFSYLKDPESSLRDYFEIKSLHVFGLEEKKLAILAAGMLFEYLKETQKTDLKHIQKISYYELNDFMPLTESCIRNLELFFTSRDSKKEGSLISVLDKSVTSMGGRLLRNWLLHPLLSKKVIDSRLDKVEVFVKNSSLLREVRENMDKLYDIERLLSRLSLGTGNARDLIAMKESLKIIPKLKELIAGFEIFSDLNENLFFLKDLVDLVEKAIVDNPPLSVRDGGIIKTGYNGELDELHSLSTEGKSFIKDLQQREIARTGISSLKVKFNRVFGYYIEISKINLASVPENYIRKQTLVNAERFITPELKEYEEKVLNAEEKIKTLEYDFFYEIRLEVVKEIVRIQKIARAVAEIDVLCNFAFLAEKNSYCKPEILENSGINLKNSRHPVIEQISFSGDFVPNDCEMDENKNFLLVTGPNMGGKSTYLRQIALNVLIAQIGSYVPAESAKIGIVDRIFTRVGASDNLVRGESTFMVEMQEAAYILNNATEKSLIILDEVGRGTSTYDGVSIAWAIMEFIHDNLGAKTLFATHYHELIQLAEKLSHAFNISVAVRENEKDGVVFLYKIVGGGVDKSYGIEVAKLAGLPVDVVRRARGVLQQLESKQIHKNSVSRDQIGLFDSKNQREHTAINKDHQQILEDLKYMDLNKLTPLDALQKLDEMKKKSTDM